MTWLLALLLSCGEPRPTADHPTDAPSAAQPPPARSHRPSFLVIDVDTMSTAHVGATRDGAPITPTLDRLGALGATFTESFAQSGWTMPGLSAVLGGRYPIQVEARPDGMRWRRAGSRNLPEILRIYGYRTAAVWGRTLPSAPGSPFVAAFEESSSGHDPPAEKSHEWLRQVGDAPFLLFVHELDLHFANALAVPEDRRPYLGGSLPSQQPSFVGIFQELLPVVGARLAIETTEAWYDSNLHLYDAEIARLLDTLDSVGRADDTIVIVTSNHGEDIFEHAYFDHGELYDPVLRVPLIVFDPAMPAPRGAIATPVQAVDIAPTVLARAGIPVDVDMDGRSLLPLLGLAEGRYESRPVFAMTSECSVAMRTPEWKLIVRYTPQVQRGTWLRSVRADEAERPVLIDDFLAERGLTEVRTPDCSPAARDAAARRDRPPGQMEAARPDGSRRPSGLYIELYDLAADPRETDNVADRHPERVEPMVQALMAWVGQRHAEAAGAETEPLSAGQERLLKEQGYWQFVEPRSE